MITMETATTYSTQQAAQAAGISYRQLDWWIRHGVIIPAREANGPGSRRAFDWFDLRLIRAVAAFRRLGMPVDDCAGVVAELSMLPPEDWSGAYISQGRIIDLADCC